MHDLSPCVEFNKQLTYKSWNEVIQKLPNDYIPDDHAEALKLAQQKDPIFVGTFIKQDIPTFGDLAAETKAKVRQSAK